ncbi:MAG: redoxin domain-containing protein, partial [Planctomycetota bacterium]
MLGAGQPRRLVVTDAAGKFTIENICKGRLRLQADAGDLSSNVDTEGGADNVKIVLGEGEPAMRARPPRPDQADAKTPPSLLGKPLPEFAGIDLEFKAQQAKNKKLLVCFWDMNKRPSRDMVIGLSERAQRLKDKDVAVICVQASKVDEKALNEWLKDSNIPFPVGMVQGNEQQTKFNWGVKSLPWLILTDWKHTVRAEGFGINELDEAAKWVRIEGRVTDPNGQPLANAEVRIHRHDVTYYEPAEITETDEQGYYRLPAVDWPYRIGAKWKEPLKNGYRRQLM